MQYIENLNSYINFKITPYVILLAFDIIFDNFGVECISQAEIDTHLELGRQFLAKRQFADALTQYNAAVEGDPHNYLTYFKRGTVYLALGKARLVLADFDRAIELQPKFIAARLNRGSVYLKTCDIEHAQLDFRSVLEEDPYNSEAADYLNKIGEIENKITYVYAFYADNQYDAAIYQLNELIEMCPWSSKFRKLRSDIHLENGDYQAAVSDLRSATKLQADNTDGYFELSKLLYSIGFVSDALKEIRECLKLDPEHKECFPFYKKIKKVEKALSDAENDKENSRYRDCIDNAEKVLRLEKEVEMVQFYTKKLLCTCYMKEDESTKAIQVCREALDIAKDAEIYCDRAEAYLQSEMYDDAIRDYQAASEINPSYERAKEGVQKAQKLQMQAERRDYYKILDVKRTASKKEIIKAYRKAAQKWHPDNFGSKSEEEKKIAEKRFIDIAAAKEVLTDPEKRAQFDNGEDPLDPEQNANRHGGNPFHHFHHGSPFQFKFHFN